MQTSISPTLADDPRAIDSEKALRKCVHCGFCLATCPTYNLLGDELDSPRGRIYLIKQVIEGHTATHKTLSHLDRCLTCRSCETTCPSGVDYGRLLDNGRALVEEQVKRSFKQRVMRKAVLAILPYSGRVAPLVKLGQMVHPVLPATSAHAVPTRKNPGQWPKNRHKRTMLVLDGCAQPSMTPATNAATARVLDSVGISLLCQRKAGCCGAIHFHLNSQTTAKAFMRRNIDVWWPAINAGAEAIITTASGCGVMVKDYGHMLKDDTFYAAKAKRVSELCKDIVEVLDKEDISLMRADAKAVGPVAFHPPCTLQHGQNLPQVTEQLLRRIGFELTSVADSHLCCGSAGTYSLFQPVLSKQLQVKKLQALHSGNPAIIATANIGCQLHLRSADGVDVVHWIELLDRLLAQQS